MCGILGWVGDRGLPVPGDILSGLVGLSHRGPDASGMHTAGGPRSECVLGHTRLRIIDLSREADQPMSNEDGSVWVAYNGELYNHSELRRELERGHRFRTRSDTECLVHLYEEMGCDPERMLQRLRGMFAFAIADVARGRVLLARDRLGIKPLYICEAQGGLAFSSEVRALVRAGFASPVVDPDAVRSYLTWGVVPGPGTILNGVRELPPGSYASWENGQVRLGRWWSPGASIDPGIAHDGAVSLRGVLADAMARHLVADRPVGLFLSGGVDSGSLAALSAASGEVRALTVVFPETGDDEGAAAAAWAERFGVHQERVEVGGKEVADLLEEILRSMDQPTCDGVNTWVVSRAARQAGLVVVLSGLGGDELFGGYSTFRTVPLVARASAVLSTVPASFRRSIAIRAGLRRPGGRGVRILSANPGYAGAYRAVRGLFGDAELDGAGAPTCVGRGTTFAPSVGDRRNGARHPWDRVMLFEMRHYLANQLLRDTDQMSMAHSLEVRVPFLDDTVVELALSLPARVRADGKRLLCRAAGIEPPQSKRTFTLPFDSWLRGPLRAPLREGLLSETLPFAQEVPRALRVRLLNGFEAGRVHWSRPWAVVVLRLWPYANGFGW